MYVCMCECVCASSYLVHFLISVKRFFFTPPLHRFLFSFLSFCPPPPPSAIVHVLVWSGDCCLSVRWTHLRSFTSFPLVSLSCIYKNGLLSALLVWLRSLYLFSFLFNFPPFSFLSLTHSLSPFFSCDACVCVLFVYETLSFLALWVMGRGVTCMERRGGSGRRRYHSVTSLNREAVTASKSH